MRFVCEQYPSLSVDVGGGRFVRFAAGFLDTDDESAAEALRRTEGVTEECPSQSLEPSPTGDDESAAKAMP